MFDILRPLTKWALIVAFTAFFLVANAALLLVLSSCSTDATCMGSASTGEALTAMRSYASLFLPGNFFICVDFMFLCVVARRGYDYALKLMDITAKAS